jgi:hypothetical protein
MQNLCNRTFHIILCFASCALPVTLHNGSNVEYSHHKVCISLLCGVQFTYTLQPDPAKHNIMEAGHPSLTIIIVLQSSVT